MSVFGTLHHLPVLLRDILFDSGASRLSFGGPRDCVLFHLFVFLELQLFLFFFFLFYVYTEVSLNLRYISL